MCKKNYLGLLLAVLSGQAAHASTESVVIPAQLQGGFPADSQEIDITATRLETFHNRPAPQAGASSYRFSAQDIDKLPQGESTPLNQVLLQAPGVVNDSFGQLHVRGDHGNLQYRINGVILPDALNGFGQSLDTRFAQNINLLTGALPAQYGNRTAGVIDITSKNNFDAGGKFELYGGSNRTFNPSVSYAASQENLSYFVSASYLSNNIGIEKPTPDTNPLHDRT